MPQAPVVHRDKAGFQAQYGTLWDAVEAYLDGDMLPAQAAAFETIVAPEFIGAVAQTRLYRELVAWMKQA